MDTVAVTYLVLQVSGAHKLTPGTYPANKTAQPGATVARVTASHTSQSAPPPAPHSPPTCAPKYALIVSVSIQSHLLINFLACRTENRNTNAPVTKTLKFRLFDLI